MIRLEATWNSALSSRVLRGHPGTQQTRVDGGPVAPGHARSPSGEGLKIRVSAVRFRPRPYHPKDLRAHQKSSLEATWNWRATWHTLATVGLALLLLAPGPRAQAADALTIGVLGASVADLATTQWAFAAVPGARDVNPLVRGPVSAVVVKAGMTAGVLLLDREFKRRGHPRAGKVLKIAPIVVWGGCAAWNVHQTHRFGR